MSCCDFNAFIHAMADETRQSILRLLQEGEMSVNDLCAHFDLQQPTISHHLAILRKAGLADSRRVGRQVFYRANQNCVAECCQMMVQRFVKITAVDTRNEVTHDESHPGPGQRD